MKLVVSGLFFEQVTRHGLMLLNESLSSTNTGESLYVAQDIVRMLGKIGLRAIFTNHLHELASTIRDLNSTGDCQVVRMVASFEDVCEEQADVADVDVHYSYLVVISPPLGRSNSDRVAARNGISLEQLVDLLHQRKVLGKTMEAEEELPNHLIY
jgi:DNA mismatch repair ATPase MutS